jgi:alkylation response protein AidB-like acyl-CoA dehydrogenase
MQYGRIRMAIVTMRSAEPRPVIAELIARAAKIGAFAWEQAEPAQAERKVPRETIDRLRDAGLFRIMQPRSYGGYEYGFDALVPLVAAVAAGCASTRHIRRADSSNRYRPSAPRRSGRYRTRRRHRR